jgi:DNA-binding transcriptional MocR family regulator
MELKLAFSLCCLALPPVAPADFLENGACEGHLRSIRHIVEENLARTIRVIEAHFSAGPKVSRAAGGSAL